MPLIEKALADDLVDLRQQQALGTEYVPIADAIAAKQHHLEREWAWRAVLAENVGGGNGRSGTNGPQEAP